MGQEVAEHHISLHKQATTRMIPACSRLLPFNHHKVFWLQRAR